MSIFIRTLLLGEKNNCTAVSMLLLVTAVDLWPQICSLHSHSTIPHGLQSYLVLISCARLIFIAIYLSPSPKLVPSPKPQTPTKITIRHSGLANSIGKNRLAPAKMFMCSVIKHHFTPGALQLACLVAVCIYSTCIGLPCAQPREQ